MNHKFMNLWSSLSLYFFKFIHQRNNWNEANGVRVCKRLIHPLPINYNRAIMQMTANKRKWCWSKINELGFWTWTPVYIAWVGPRGLTWSFGLIISHPMKKMFVLVYQMRKLVAKSIYGLLDGFLCFQCTKLTSMKVPLCLIHRVSSFSWGSSVMMSSSTIGGEQVKLQLKWHCIV